MAYVFKIFYFLILSILLLISKTNGKTTLEVDKERKQSCTCVPYYQCTDDFGDLITDGVGLIDIRNYKNSENASCKGYYDVCCNATNKSLVPTSEVPEIVFGCGFLNGGFFPWHAAIFVQEDRDLPAIYRCGATLINPRVIITAAHCVDFDLIITVRIGKEIRQLSKTVMHPKYNKASLRNDLAIGIFDKPVKITEKINTICISPPGMVLENTECIVTRARDVNEKSYYSKMMKLPIISRSQCAKMLRMTRLGPYFQLHNSFLCTGGDNERDMCAGDGGNSLVCPIPGHSRRYHQAGIVSWGIGCGENGNPDVYVKLSIFRDWIDEQMIKYGLDIMTYRY